MWGRLSAGRRRPRPPVAALATASVLALVLALGGLALAFGAPRGPVVHTIVLGAYPGDLTLDPDGRYALLSTSAADPRAQASAPGPLLVFDLRAGALTHSIDLGMVPLAVVSDARRARFIVNGNGALTFISMRTGHVFSTVTSPSFQPSIAADDARDRVYGLDYGAAGASTSLDIFDARQGALLRQATLDGSPDLAAMDSAGDIAIDGRIGYVYVPYTSVLSTPSTRVMTDRVAVFDSSGHPIRTVTLGRFSGQGNSTFSLVVDAARGRVIAVDSNTGDVSTFDERSGRLVRRLHLAAASSIRRTMMAIAFGPFALDKQTGHAFLTIPRRQVCTFLRASSGASLGRCVPTGPPGQLYMLDTRTGRVLRRLPAGNNPGWIMLDAQAGCVLVRSDRGLPPSAAAGTLRAFDALTGALRWRMSVGPGGSDRRVVVDDATGRIYLLNGQGSIAPINMRTGRASVGDMIPALAPADPASGGVDVAITHGHVIVVRTNGRSVPPVDPLGWLPDGVRRLLPWQPPRPRPAPGSVSIFDAPRS